MTSHTVRLGARPPLTSQFMDATLRNMSLDLVSLLITIGGFAFAIWQLHRTHSAATAATKAVQSAERRLASNHLLVLVTQLQNIESTLEAGVLVEDRNGVVRSLSDWRRTAVELRGLLSSRPTVPDELVEALGRSVDASLQAKLSMTDSKHSLADATIEARPAMSKAADLAGELAGKIKANSGEALGD
ncbi:MAG: hypothetical protein F4Y98_02825 [Chloroflexi bacterium]|nr:hypothetical protein [Chloroflexota bacterium]